MSDYSSRRSTILSLHMPLIESKYELINIFSKNKMNQIRAIINDEVTQQFMYSCIDKRT